jgi:hypothetical protein
MIYLFHGSDAQKTRTKAFEWIAKAKAKEPNLAYVRLAREEQTPAALQDAALSGGLFVKRLLILIDDPFSGARAADENEENVTEENTGNLPKSDFGILEEHLDSLAASDNAIVILAPKLTGAKAKKISTKAKLEYRFDLAFLRSPARRFNTDLVDALGRGERETLWLEINRALYAGDAPEMLHGILHWKVRNLMEKRGQKWTQEKGRTLSLTLIKLLQESRRGGLDLALSLERFALVM